MKIELTRLQASYLEALVSGEIEKLGNERGLPCLVRVGLKNFREILATIEDAKIRCGRCGTEISDEFEAEPCWHCGALLCLDCCESLFLAARWEMP